MNAASTWTGDVVLMGDSITAAFSCCQSTYLAQYNPLNLGVGGDTTQGLMWRLANGEFPPHQPKACVILIGTNDLTAGIGDGAAIASRIIDMTKWIWDRWINTLIIVQKVYPRAVPGLNNDVNSINSNLNISLPNVLVIDCAAQLPVTLAYFQDLLHPNAVGYDVIWKCILPYFQ